MKLMWEVKWGCENDEQMQEIGWEMHSFNNSCSVWLLQIDLFTLFLRGYRRQGHI
jgi:hypothetical protein